MVQDNEAYLLKLLNLAEGQKSHSKKIEIFYRNKDSTYFEKVEQNGNVLPVIEKDNGGDRRSPINESLKGVFLDTTLWGGQLPHKSPFGSERIQFPIAGLFDKTTNLYFTDFYCKVKLYRPGRRGRNRSSTINHYVTLVLSKRGSEADRFCKENLVRLNPNTNPFLRRCEVEGKEPEFTTVAAIGSLSSLHVEVFYTEEIRINELKEHYGDDRVKRTPTGIIGTGSSTNGGLAKNSSCCSCNPSTSDSDQQPHYVLSAQDDSEDEDAGTNALENGKIDDSEDREPNQEEPCVNVHGSEGDVTEGRQSNETMEIHDGAEEHVSGEDLKDDGTQKAPKEKQLSGVEENPVPMEASQATGEENIQISEVEKAPCSVEGLYGKSIPESSNKIGSFGKEENLSDVKKISLSAERNQDAISHDIGEKNSPVEGNGELSEIKEIPVAVEEVHVESIEEPATENDPFEKDKEPKPEVIVDVQNRKVKEVSEPLEDREHSSKDPSRFKLEVNVDKEKVRHMDGVHESEIINKKRKYEELSSSEEEHPRKKRLID